MKSKFLLPCCIFLCFLGSILHAQEPFKNPIVKQGRLGSPLVETSPFVFNDKLYLLENHQRFWDLPNTKPGDYFHEDEVRIRDVASDKIVSVLLKNHGFATVLTYNDRVYVFAGNYGENKPWRKMTEISMTSSADLKTWTEPQTILKASKDEFFFNTAVCRGKDSFILLYETNDKSWKPFTLRYKKSDDLINWEAIPHAIYGRDKYVGGPALYYEDNWYYTLYLEDLENGYETRITRSKDLVHWEDAPTDRPFVTFDPSHNNIPLRPSHISESNASDVELCYFKGQTILYFTGSDQKIGGDLQWATFDGTPSQLFEHFFKDIDVSTGATPDHEGDWTPVLIAGKNQNNKVFGAQNISDKPSVQQLAYQERQLGAFIHFGPATYTASDFMTVPATDIFNPEQLDAEQWVKTAKSFGAEHIVLTAKHHNGYCLWPTETTDYSVKNSPWKDGNGDVVSEFVKACRKYDMKIGLYISGGDKHFGCTSTPDPQGERKLVGDINSYFPIFLEQLRELLTNYGEVSYVWFDGAYDPFGWDVMDSETLEPLGTAYGDAIRSMVRNLQPKAIVMGGTKPDVRWSGSEQGWAAYPLWNVVKPGAGLKHWIGPQNAGWVPAEANLHTRSTWFWAPNSDNTLRDLNYLKTAYKESIGRGANLLINMTPDTSGLIPKAETERLADFGEILKNTFKNPIGSIYPPMDKPMSELLIELPKKEKVNLLVIEEAIKDGQHIKNYTVDVLIKNKWVAVAEGQSIGRKRIQNFDPIKTNKIRLRVQGDSHQLFIKSFAIYFADI